MTKNFEEICYDQIELLVLSGVILVLLLLVIVVAEVVVVVAVVLALEITILY